MQILSAICREAYDKITSSTERGSVPMAIKWIVTDMDGTLLDSNDKIMPMTKRCLKKCQQQGIKLILASGRSYSRLKPYVRELEMEKYGGSLIEVNGMAINHLGQGKRTIFGRLQRTDIEELFPFLQSLDIEVQCYRDESLYSWIPESQIPLKEQERKERALPEDYPWIGGAWSWVTDSRSGYPDQKLLSSIEEVPDELNKLGCLGAPEYMEKVFQILVEKYGSSYEIVRTCPRLIEISPKGITKGKALKRYMEQENISPDEVLVFGDGENDVDMFRQVKYSIAVGNAADFVKAQAYGVTAGNCEEGLAKAISMFVELGEDWKGAENE